MEAFIQEITPHKILGGLTIILIAWIIKRTLSATFDSFRKFKEKNQTESLYLRFSTNIAFDRARYRDLFIQRSILLSIKNLAISAAFAIGGMAYLAIGFYTRLSQGTASEIKDLFFLSLGSILILISIIHVFFAVKILNVGMFVNEKWMLNVEKEHVE